MSDLNNLLDVDWISIPNAPYIMKYVFHDTGYNVIISNLTSLYSEKLTENDIMKRFCVLNPFAQMKLQVILENLKKSLEKCFSEKSDLSMTLNVDKIIISLEFPVSHVLCKYDIKMDVMEADKVTHYILGPTVLNAVLCQRKISELQKKISLHESTKSSFSPHTSVPTQHTIDPDWFNGQNVSIETILDSFLKIQSYFKVLYAENHEVYNSSRKEKSKSESSVQHVSMQKKLKLQENVNKATKVKFEDDGDNERISIKEEETESCNIIPSQTTKSNVKKKNFKI